MGMVKGYYEWQWEEAFDHINKALKINPSLAIAYYHRAWFHALFGRTAEAIEDHKRAKETDPFNPLHVAWLGELYRYEGRLDEAEAEIVKTIEMDPNYAVAHFVQGFIWNDRGMPEKAIESFQSGEKIYRPLKFALGPAYVWAGRVEEARGILAELNKLPADPWVAFWRAATYTALGENDEAFHWLEFKPFHAWVAWSRVWDLFEPLWEDPRFPDLLRRMNLPPR
jgi:tetratricopeptide (TPR) repeat protein